jgi:very-short-patch-repair endonuclease
MSFREHMSTVVSNAEWLIRQRLSALDVRGLEFQKQFVLDAHNVDIYGELLQSRHVFEIDGPIHFTSEKVKVRDEYVQDWFERRGINVWHLPYTPPLSEKRLAEIVEFIQSKGFHGRTIL